MDYFEMKEKLNVLNIKLGNKVNIDKNDSSSYLSSLLTKGKGSCIWN